MPALERYDGFLYRQCNVKEDIRKTIDFNNNHLLIISAIYGVLHPDDYIQNYDLKIGRSKIYWKNVIPKVIDNYTLKNSITKIRVILAGSYLEVAGLCKKRPQGVDIEIFTFVDGNSNATPRCQGILLHNLLAGDNKTYSLSLRKKISCDG